MSAEAEATTSIVGLVRTRSKINSVFCCSVFLDSCGALCPNSTWYVPRRGLQAATTAAGQPPRLAHFAHFFSRQSLQSRHVIKPHPSCNHPRGRQGCRRAWLARKDRPWRFRFDDCPLADDTRPSAFSKTRRRPRTNDLAHSSRALCHHHDQSKHTSTGVEHVPKRRKGLDNVCKSGHMRPKALWRPPSVPACVGEPSTHGTSFFGCPFQSALSRQPPSIRILLLLSSKS